MRAGARLMQVSDTQKRVTLQRRSSHQRQHIWPHRLHPAKLQGLLFNLCIGLLFLILWCRSRGRGAQRAAFNSPTEGQSSWWQLRPKCRSTKPSICALKSPCSQGSLFLVLIPELLKKVPFENISLAYPDSGKQLDK